MKNLKSSWIRISSTFVFTTIAISNLAYANMAYFKKDEATVNNTNFFEIYIDPSATKLDWSSPYKLARTYFSSSIKQSVADFFGTSMKSSVGHAVVRFNCTDSNGVKQSFYTGMSGEEDSDQSYEDLVNKQMGLGLLFKSFDDGYLETDEESRNLIAHHSSRKEMNRMNKKVRLRPLHMRFPINSKQCDRALDVYNTFKNVSYEEAKSNLDQLPPNEKVYFGLTLDAFQSYQSRKKDPQAVLGGICTSFAAAIIKATGLFDPFFESQWIRNVKASANIIGGINPETNEPYRIPLKTLLSKDTKDWITPGIPVSELSYYEPEKIWEFIDGTMACRNHLKKQNTTDPLPKNCNPQLLAWVAKNKKNIKVHQVSYVIGDFEKTEVTTISKDIRQTHIIEYQKPVGIDGIELLSPTQ